MNNWTPITPLSIEEQNADFLSMQALYESWRTQKKRLQDESPAGLQEFNQRLIRRLSVETGILERIYDLDRGTTESLVENGFREDLVSRSNTDIEPSRLINILRDQESAIKLVVDCVAGNRPLTKSVLHELHATLVNHQDTTEAVDQFGSIINIPLLKGRFKQYPNNPKRSDGEIHEYCPPIHVDTEIENLLKWLEEYKSLDPILVASWLHHRFTQIHPYQDGNGRLARALTTLVLLKAGLLPLIVDRSMRLEYIESLELADRGKLNELARIFARLEKSAILQALSVADDSTRAKHPISSDVLEALKEKFGKRREAKDATLRKVNNIAVDLRKVAVNDLAIAFSRLKEAILQVAETEIHFMEGGTDKKSGHWYKYEVVKSANEAGKFANFHEDHYFSRATVRSGREQLVFVTSFHHVGRELSGIMEATSFARLETFENSDDTRHSTQEFTMCSTEPFVFTFASKKWDVEADFGEWLDTALAVAMKEFGDRL